MTWHLKGNVQGRSWVILRGGRRYVCNRKDEIIHGLCHSLKCVAPLFRDMALARVLNSAPPSWATGNVITIYYSKLEQQLEAESTLSVSGQESALPGQRW